MIGDWVAWKPETAPQATVMKRSGQIGSCFGCRFSSVISGMTCPPTPKSMPPMMPSAMTIRQMPKTG